MKKSEIEKHFTKKEMENKITDLSIKERWINSEWADIKEENARRMRFLMIANRHFAQEMSK